MNILLVGHDKNNQINSGLCNEWTLLGCTGRSDVLVSSGVYTSLYYMFQFYWRLYKLRRNANLLGTVCTEQRSYPSVHPISDTILNKDN